MRNGLDWSILKEDRSAYRKKGLACFLATLPSSDLAALNLPADVLYAIDEARQEDDYWGVGAAYLGMALTHGAPLPADRVVAGQIIMFAGMALIRGVAITKSGLKDNEVLTKPGVIKVKEIETVIDKDKFSTSVYFGDTFDEEMERVIKYIEEYNAFVGDTAAKIDVGDVTEEDLSAGDGANAASIFNLWNLFK